MIREIRILGFFGNHDVLLDFSRGALIVVGPNGIGKSTVANILYFVLTRQWRKLYELPFDAVSISGDEELLITKKDLEEFVTTRPFERRFRIYMDRLRGRNLLDDFIASEDLGQSKLNIMPG